MADTLFVSKIQLISLIRKVVGKQKTGLVSILTDNEQAVLLKFATGKLIHFYSRGRDIEEVIQVLNDSVYVKFNFVPISMASGPELMPVETFIQLMEANNSYDMEPDPFPTLPGAAALENRATEQLKELLVEIALDYVGPIADMLVDEAFENSSDPVLVIEYIAEMIPDPRMAAKFLAVAAKALA